MSADFQNTLSDSVIVMPSQKNSHKAWKSKEVGYKTVQVLRNHTTGNDFEDSLIVDMRLYRRASIHVIEKGGENGVSYAILACMDGSKWMTLNSDDLTVAAGLDDMQSIQESDCWNYLKIQVKSTTPDSAAKVDAFITVKQP